MIFMELAVELNEYLQGRSDLPPFIVTHAKLELHDHGLAPFFDPQSDALNLYLSCAILGLRIMENSGIQLNIKLL